jgi:predicted esterase
MNLPSTPFGTPFARLTSTSALVSLSALVLGCSASAAPVDEDKSSSGSSTSSGGLMDAGPSSSSSTGSSGQGGSSGLGSSGMASSSGGSSGIPEGPGDSTGPGASGCAFGAHATGTQLLQKPGGLAFTTYAPANYDKNVGHPMVVIMHGAGLDGSGELRSLWQEIADRDQLVLVAPQGSATAQGARIWNKGSDAPQVLATMTELDKCYNIFKRKHFLWGFSDGGYMVYQIGIQSTKRFAGLAPAGCNTANAQNIGLTPASCQWKIPISHSHGQTERSPIEQARRERDQFVALGHVFSLNEHPGGHSIRKEFVDKQWADLKSAVAPQ